MDRPRLIGLIGAGVVSVLFCLGLGWGPAQSAIAPERIALLGLVATGLLWPAVVLVLVHGRGRDDPSELSAAEAQLPLTFPDH